MSKALLKGLFAVAAVAALFLSQARAADDTKSQTYVVVVGIDQYKDPQILPRKHAEADAKMLYDVFTDPDYLGVGRRPRSLAAGQGRPAQRANRPPRKTFSKSLNWVVDNATKDDLVLFVYLGQGGR